MCSLLSKLVTNLFHKKMLVLNKLAYLSMCQLYLSQILIYNFNHNFLNKTYGSKT